MIIPIEDKICWICGEDKHLTKHHVLPQHLKPINNLIVPVCEKCHDKLNEEDFQSLYPLLTKISLSLREIVGAINRTNNAFKEADKKIRLGGYLNKK